MERLFDQFQIAPHAIIPYDETRLGFRHGDKLAISRITSADRKFKYFALPTASSSQILFRVGLVKRNRFLKKHTGR
jgi:hypothetical protein